jgi:polycystin 2
LQGNVTLLQLNNWIDRQTRAVIVEFSIFNPNINLICVAEIIIEFPPSGTILTSSRFDPIQVFTNLSLFQAICYILYMLFIIYYSIQEIRQAFKQGKIYLLQFWTIVEWLIIGFSWTAFGLFFYKMNTAYKVGQFFKHTSGYGYFKFQNIVYWNLIFNYSLSFCIALGTLKFIKVFQCNNVLLQLGETLKNCINELIAFSFMFLAIFGAFVQVFHMSFQNKMSDFSAFSRSMISCFEIMLGKFEVDPFLELNSILGLIIYVFYNILIVFILLPVFITIISGSFKVVCDRLKKQDDSMSAYLLEKLYNLFSNKNKYKSSYCEKSKVVYKDQIEYLSDKIDEILLAIDWVKVK